MELGLSERVALVCGSSSGLGRACAESLLQAGCTVFLNGRNEKRLLEAVDRVACVTKRQPGYVIADVTTEQGRAALLSRLPSVDILVNNCAGPPTGDFSTWDERDWHAAVAANMVAPIMLIKAYLGPMRARRWGRVINITSSAVKAPLPLLGLSNGARSGLTGFVAGLARDVADEGVTINNLLPGRFATDRLNAYIAKVAAGKGIDIETAGREFIAGNPMKRFGRPAEFGTFCAFLASEQAAYMTGQNILLDGGEYRGL
ncbi:hypothetical protein C7T35_32050 [Variovorax sp. WS11]|uniref:SDR family oxidoreductase n=1 Tax=Variovorax sp. WS11 TaxID=1105204 RepID=UPI000D0D5F38|nr:SDR family oxidoreductase [Variovorax sp. WS11]NDZ17728.1 SDR family oxidoreductase [Variovorax sp. WS11]PSL80491.1 hypothetical protein C7T35_32050 [Variovorax sp. WS11]